MNIVIGIADLAISNNPTDTLITYSLGSCLGITLYDPNIRCGGLIHCMMPMSKINPEKADNNPFLYVDTGVSAFMQKMFDLGATRKTIIAKVAGGSQILDDNKTFNIGERNYTVLRKVLWKNNILISGEDVGGSVPRTMSLHLDTGITVLKIAGSERKL